MFVPVSQYDGFLKSWIKTTVKQASHWYDKRFTPWHAIWRANEGRTRDSVRGDAWRCGSGEAVRAKVVVKILKCSKIYFQGVTTYHDEIVCHAFREQFETYA